MRESAVPGGGAPDLIFILISQVIVKRICSFICDLKVLSVILRGAGEILIVFDRR